MNNDHRKDFFTDTQIAELDKLTDKQIDNKIEELSAAAYRLECRASALIAYKKTKFQNNGEIFD